MDIGNTIQQFSIFLLPVLFAITVHEAAHGWMAMKHGDKTAMMLGRVTLNPFKHIDPVGTILVPTATFFLSGFLFGWAKPVPVNWRNLHNPRRDMAYVALAGPGANLLMAIGWALAIKIGVMLMPYSEWVGLPLVYMGGAGVLINTLLMVLNMMPVLPLDGGRILNSLLPPKLAYQFSRLEPFGMFIVIGLLLMTPVPEKVLLPLVMFTIDILPASEIVKEIYF
ncbi:MAG: site-2 protease family protein [Sedimenticola sp.]